MVRDDDRPVNLVDDEEAIDDEPSWVDDAPVLPRSTRDDTDAGWGEQARGNDDRLLAERPPHWDD
jgi:hypothetical protein